MFRSVSFKLLLCQNRIFDCNNFILHNLVNIVLKFCECPFFLRSWFNSWLRRFVWISLTLKTCDLIITWGRRMHRKCSFVFKCSLKSFGDFNDWTFHTFGFRLCIYINRNCFFWYWGRLKYWNNRCNKSSFISTKYFCFICCYWLNNSY